jgi:uncharacterized protein (TIGR03437 family)
MKRSVILAFLAALPAVTPQAAGQQYLITPLFLQGGAIPGLSTNTWSVNAGAIPTLPLTIEGNYVAFVQCGAISACGPAFSTDGVWSENVSTQTFTHLVSPGQPAPGTTGGTFGGFGGFAVLSGGTVFFLSTDTATNGWYAVPVTGGAVTVIANRSTKLPGFSGTPSFQLGNSFQYLPQADGKHFAFFAKDSSGVMYNYLVNLDGTGLTEVAGPASQIMTPGSCSVPVVSYLQPRVLGSNLVLMGSTNNGIGPFLYKLPLTGFPAAPTCTPGGFVVYNPILEYNTQLPGELSTVQFFYASYLALDNSHVYFTAAGGASPGSYGVFQENLDGTGLTAILNSTKPAGGIYPPYNISGGTTGFAAENGTLVFGLGGVGADGSSSAGALLAYENGSLVRIVGSGDTLNGITGIYWAPPVAANSISNGRVVFSFGNPEQIGIFVATPSGQGSIVNAAAFTPGAAAVNTILTLFASSQIPSLACSASPQVLVNGVVASNLYAGASQINFVVPAGVGSGNVATIQVVCNSATVETVALPLNAVGPAVFTQTGTGSGAGSIVNQDGSINGATHPATRGGYISIYVTGFGPFNAASSDGLRRLTYPVTATVGGLTATVSYAGEAPGETSGLQEINIQIPAGAPTGVSVPIVLTANGINTQPGVTVTIQ